MSIYKFVDDLQRLFDKDYDKRQRNKNIYIEKRAELFKRYANGELTLEEMEQERDGLRWKYLHG